jgi:hypothetical protein
LSPYSARYRSRFRTNGARPRSGELKTAQHINTGCSMKITEALEMAQQIQNRER